MQDESVIRQIHRLREMTVGELRIEWERLYGEPARSSNRDHLWRRLAWRVQELAYGGLSDRAKERLDELAPEILPRAKPAATATAALPPPPTHERSNVRDLRLPAVGSVIMRQWRGREIRVVVLDDGFEYGGSHFTSLSALAREVTGQRWNGWLFFGLTGRKRRT